jgi:hypothetical protein
MANPPRRDPRWSGDRDGLFARDRLLLHNLLRLQSSGNLDYRNAIGIVDTVCSTILAAEAGGGQLELMLQREAERQQGAVKPPPRADEGDAKEKRPPAQSKPPPA